MRSEPVLATDEYEFADRPSLKTSTPKRIAVEVYTKFMPRSLGRYHILSNGPECLNTARDSVENIVSNSCVALRSADSIRNDVLQYSSFNNTKHEDPQMKKTKILNSTQEGGP